MIQLAVVERPRRNGRQRVDLGRARHQYDRRRAVEPVVRSSAITAFLFIFQAFVCHELMHTHFYNCFWK